MPYSLPFVKVNVEGHFGSTAIDIKEKWIAGFHITKNGGVIGGTSELTAFLTAIRSHVGTYHSDVNVASGSVCWLDAVSGAYIDTDGHYALGALQTTTRVPMSSSVQGQGSASNPWSTALVITLRSLLTRGPASHGRIYWPRTGLGIDSTTGLLLAGKPALISAAAKLMLDNINAAAVGAFGGNAGVGLVSNKLTGFQSPATRVLIGNKMDSMESREGELIETYAANNLIVAAALVAELDSQFRDAFEELLEDRDDA